jgi:hypothetical protein
VVETEPRSPRNTAVKKRNLTIDCRALREGFGDMKSVSLTLIYKRKP